MVINYHYLIKNYYYYYYYYCYYGYYDYYYHYFYLNPCLARALKRFVRFWQDYEELLLEKVRTMPAKERNGTFLIRDSNSSPDSKVSVKMRHSSSLLFQRETKYTNTRATCCFPRVLKVSRDARVSLPLIFHRNYRLLAVENRNYRLLAVENRFK